MADGTDIEWTDATWQIVTGCDIVSPGCTNCYAMRLAGGRLQHHPSREGLTKIVNGKPVWTGEVRFNRDWLKEPLGWTRPRMIFVAAHGDLFHEKVERHWLDQIFAVMALAKQHTFQVLTKRPELAARYTSGNTTMLPQQRVAQEMRKLDPRSGGRLTWPLPNVWIGTSVEDQKRAVRLYQMHGVQAAVKWASFEPLLGPIDARNIVVPANLVAGGGPSIGTFDALTGVMHFETGRDLDYQPLGWAVVGGESGPGARPMHPDWARQLRDDCTTAGTPYFFKQHGSWMPVRAAGIYENAERIDYADGTAMVRVSKKIAGRLLDGVEHNGMPGVAQ